MKIRSLTAAIALSSMAAAPVFAQGQLSNNQPVTKLATAEETRIQAKLKLDYSKGLIDSNQLSQMQRDFDAILVHEDNFKQRGMTSSGTETIIKELANFEVRLDKSAGVSTTKEAVSIDGPKVDKNNAGLSSVAPTQ